MEVSLEVVSTVDVEEEASVVGSLDGAASGVVSKAFSSFCSADCCNFSPCSGRSEERRVGKECRN